MIKSCNGEIVLAGSEAEIRADLCVAIKTVREDFLQARRGYGAEEAEEIMNRIIEHSRKSDEEITRECAERTKEIVLEIIADFFGGGHQ